MRAPPVDTAQLTGALWERANDFVSFPRTVLFGPCFCHLASCTQVAFHVARAGDWDCFGFFAAGNQNIQNPVQQATQNGNKHLLVEKPCKIHRPKRDISTFKNFTGVIWFAWLPCSPVKHILYHTIASKSNDGERWWILTYGGISRIKPKATKVFIKGKS